MAFGLSKRAHGWAAAPKLASAEGHLKRFRVIMDAPAQPARCGMALRRLIAARDDLSTGACHLSSGGRTKWTAELRQRLSGALGLATSEFERSCLGVGHMAGARRSKRR